MEDLDWFDQISSPEWLQKGWDKVRINGGGPGEDGLTIIQFEKNAASRLLGLSRKLRSGKYAPSAARRTYIPKKSGGVRPLDIPSINDRIIQASVALFLQPHFEEEFEDPSFAYRPGRGVRDAVRRVARHRREGFNYVVDADIKRYFERISHDLLIYKLEEIIADARLVDLIWTWLEWYAPHGRGVPQGSPLSPALANLFLDRVDEEIAGRGVRLVRYADDFVLLCKSEKTAEAALVDARKLLSQHGLELHDDKTRITSFAKGFRFLGHVFVRSLVFQDTALDETPPEDAIEAIQEALRADAEAAENLAVKIERDLDGAHTGSQPKDLTLSRRWRTLYVLEPGRRLDVAGEVFNVMEGETRLLSIAAERVGRIEIGKEVSIATAALDLAGAHDVPLVRLDGYGAPVGQWVPTSMDDAPRHLAQFAHAHDIERSLTSAKAVVSARIRSQWSLLKRMDQKNKRPELAAISVQFQRLWRRIPYVETWQDLLGWEGHAGQLFWPQFSAYLPKGWHFPARRRIPATGMAEAALNVAVSLLARDVQVGVRRAGLHTGVGFYHRPREDGHPLVYDLMEEFRAPLAEACVAAAIGRKQLQPFMFRRSNHLGWSLSRDGYKAVVKAYETNINRSLTDPVDNQRTTWRGLILMQAERFALCCEEGTDYQPFILDY